MIACIKCGEEIDAVTIAAVKKAKARLFPGQDPPPPKVCAPCLWESFQDLVDDDGVADTKSVVPKEKK